MSEVRIIKRYQNRKLYDTHQSCYVTLEEIAQIIRDGNEIQVIDNKSKNDITYITQIQLLFDQERKSTKGGNVNLLKRVIRSNEGTFTGYISSLENTALGIEPQVTTTEKLSTPSFATTQPQAPELTSQSTSNSSFENSTLN
jgi:polyhydroxyalkanoate synthesis repressor PhaR